MSLLSYLRGLLPEIKKTTVLEDLTVAATELDESTLPVVLAAKELFEIKDFESKEAQALNRLIQNRVRGVVRNAPTFFPAYVKLLNALKVNIQTVLVEARATLPPTMVTQSLQAKKAEIIRFAEYVALINRNTADLVNLILAYETAASKKSSDIGISKAEIESTRYRALVVADLLVFYGIDPIRFKERLKKQPDIYVTSETQELLEPTDLEAPLSLNVPKFIGSPIYAIRLSIADWQTQRYDASVEKKKMIELRLLQLKSGNVEDVQDLDRSIRVYQDRLSRINRRIEETERDLKIPGDHP